MLGARCLVLGLVLGASSCFVVTFGASWGLFVPLGPYGVAWCLVLGALVLDALCLSGLVLLRKRSNRILLIVDMLGGSVTIAVCRNFFPCTGFQH